MPNAYGRAFTTANFLLNLTALKAINFGASDPIGCWFVVPNQTTNNVEIWVWEPTSTATTNEIDVIRPDSVVPGSPGRCIQRLKFDASSLDGILAAIAALNTAGLIECTATGEVSTTTVSTFAKTFLDDIDADAARTTLGLGAAATRAIGTASGSIRDAADAAYTNARTPTDHAASHGVGGTDIIPIFGYLAVSTNSTLTASNQRQLIDTNATSAAITITLPSAATVGSGWAVQIRKSDASANLVIISRAGTDLINGATTLSLAVQHQSLILFSLGGTSWGVVAGFPGMLPANSLLGTGATPGMVSVIPSSTFASLIGGVVPAAQLPSFVDDVLEFVALANFPATGESGKIYVATGTGITYRWSGTTYVEISASLALGITSATAYRGDFGNTAYLHSQTAGNPHSTTAAQIGLPNLTNHLQVNTTENQTVGGDKTFTGIIQVTNTTQSTSTTTGAHIVDGGQAVKGNQYVGGDVNVAGKVKWNNIISIINTIPLNIAANTWFSVGQIAGLGISAQGRAYLVCVYFQYGEYYMQYCGSTTIGAILWKAGGVNLPTASFRLECHYQNDINCQLKFSGTSFGSKTVEILVDTAITTTAPSLLKIDFISFT